MNETVKIWLIDMIDAEIKEVTSNISNQKLWMHGVTDVETVAMFVSNINDLEEYKEILFTLRKQIYGGKINARN